MGKLRVKSKSQKSGQLRQKASEALQEKHNLQKKLKDLNEEVAQLKEQNKELEHKIIRYTDELDWQKAQLKFEREEKKQLELRLTRKERRKNQISTHQELTEQVAELKNNVDKLNKKRQRIASEVKMLHEMKDQNILGSATLVLVDLPNIQATAQAKFGHPFPLQQILRNALKYRNPRVFIFANPPTAFFNQLSDATKGDNRIQIRRVTQAKERGEGNGPNRYQDVDATLVLVGTQQAETRNYNKLILFSGDGDFLPLIRLCKKKGMKATIVGVEGTISSVYRDSVKKVKYITPLHLK